MAGKCVRLIGDLSDNEAVTYLGLFEPDGVRGGILRSAEKDAATSFPAPVIPASLVRDLRLDGGELIEVSIENPDQHYKVVLQSLKSITSIDGRDLDDHHDFSRFDELPRFDTFERLTLSSEGGPLAMRVMDLFAPLGVGQHGLIVAEEGAGKSILVQQIANSIAKAHSEIEVMVLVLGERPEEVTNMERSIPGGVISSSSYRDDASHVRTAELALMRARRLVESGKDVFVLIDSLTELVHAYNSEVRDPQRVIEDVLNPVAIDRIQEILNSAVDVEGGGSLTILGSVVAGTGNELDGLIFESLCGKGGMEVFLSSELAGLKIWPAIDIGRSGGCVELLNSEELGVAEDFRKKLAKGSLEKSIQALHKKMLQYESNGELLEATS